MSPRDRRQLRARILGESWPRSGVPSSDKGECATGEDGDGGARERGRTNRVKVTLRPRLRERLVAGVRSDDGTIAAGLRLRPLTLGLRFAARSQCRRRRRGEDLATAQACAAGTAWAAGVCLRPWDRPHSSSADVVSRIEKVENGPGVTVWGWHSIPGMTSNPRVPVTRDSRCAASEKTWAVRSVADARVAWELTSSPAVASGSGYGGPGTYSLPLALFAGLRMGALALYLDTRSGGGAAGLALSQASPSRLAGWAVTGAAHATCSVLRPQSTTPRPSMLEVGASAISPRRSNLLRCAVAVQGTSASAMNCACATMDVTWLRKTGVGVVWGLWARAMRRRESTRFRYGFIIRVRDAGALWRAAWTGLHPEAT